MHQDGFRLIIGVMRRGDGSRSGFGGKAEEKTVAQFPGGFFEPHSVLFGMARNIAGPLYTADPAFFTESLYKIAFFGCFRAQSVIKNSRGKRLSEFMQLGQ